jgi:hypothetical protein
MDDDEMKNFAGILGNLAAQPGGLLGGLFPPQPPYGPQQPGARPFGADPNAISLAAAESAAELARTLRNIDHQAAIMAAFGKAMGAPGTQSADSGSQGVGPGRPVSAEVPDADSYAPAPSDPLGAQAAGDTVGAAGPSSPAQSRKPSRRQAPQWPPRSPYSPTSSIPTDPPWVPNISSTMTSNGQVENRWPVPENPETSTLLQGIAAVPSQTWPKINLPTLQRYGIDPDDLVGRIVRAEDASQNSSAKNPWSSATGLGQFTDGTWPEVLKNYKRDLYDWFSPDPDNKKRLELRFDPTLSRQMAGAYADQNAKALTDAHLPVTNTNIYLAHHFGAEGAKKILTADPNASAPSVVSTKALQDNSWITPTMAARDLIQWAEDRMEHGAGWRRPPR